ncbi:GAF domain-containing protein [Aureimonas leprariae]|uniref:Blue-light-activated histidine kinase n=1 Tax=Plantimonas leprariae TaxID=2615207 RepID=A0A7V7PKE7_9HYPH|nr:GAF domain-containing protein [Aureimonas leprariae]KAB0676283.1 GAF domain-containing protein [Aureimonas leprariae]
MAENPYTSIVADPPRLAALDAYAVLDTPAEPGFDDVVHLACRLCSTPVALVSLVASDRQWFKARLGFPSCQTDLNSSVCAHALSTPDRVLVIPDLTEDPRTSANPLVTGEPHIRFYAGAPLVTADGDVLGTLCVIDHAPRPDGLSAEQKDDLKALARQVMTLLELRRAVVVRDRLREQDRHWRELFGRLDEGFLLGEVIRDADGRARDWRFREVNPAWSRLLGVDPDAVIGRTVREAFPDIEQEWIDEFVGVVDSGRPATFTRQVGTLHRWYEGRAFRLEEDRFGVLFLEVTARVAADTRRAALLSLGDRLRDLTDIGEMTRAASEIVGRTLGATRAGFGRVDTDVETVAIEPDWTAPGMSSIAGVHRFEDYGDLRHELMRGEPLIIDDVDTDPRTRDDPGRMHDVAIGALVNMPVRERGRTVAVVIAHDVAARHWTAEELAFLRNVADRLQAGVARVHAEDQQAVLNRELAHRLKNTLAIVQSLATQTLKDVPERAPIEAFDRRILALSRAHDVLMQKSWSAARMRDVMAGVLTIQADLDRFAFDGPDLDIGPQAALSLSLLLHELATNALKYGSLSSLNGRVNLAWRTEDGAEPVLVLDWAETGGPQVVPPSNRGGFGTKLIRMGLLGTRRTDLRYEPAGLRVEFRAPLSEIQEAAA